MLSSLLSWGAKKYPLLVTDGDTEFRNRVPLACAMATYQLENALVKLNNTVFSKSGSIGVIIIGIGILYGKDGYDLKDILR